MFHFIVAMILFHARPAIYPYQPPPPPAIARGH